MRASLELSFYPLQEEYKPVIIDLIDALKSNPALVVHGNVMSTQVFGTYEAVTAVLNNELRRAFEAAPTAIAVMKLVNVDLEA